MTLRIRIGALGLCAGLLFSAMPWAGASSTEGLEPMAAAELAEKDPEPQELPIELREYSEGMAPARQGELWGYAGTGGTVRVPIQYDDVSSFSLGLAEVYQQGRLGVIRTDGSYLIPLEYDTLLPIDYGLFIAQKGERWGVVSILPYTEDGEKTWEIYPITYASVEIGTSGGLSALILTAEGGGRTVTPLFRLPGMLSALGVEGSQFPLTHGKLPSFADVTGTDWFSLWVDIAYNTGIMAGTGGNLFEPGRVITVAEALQMAANMDSRYRGDNFHTTAHVSKPWYNDAVSYCLASGIISGGDFDNYEREITRRELAQVFAATSLAKSLPVRNNLTKVYNAVTDMTAEDPAAQAVYGLYAKGILTGVDGAMSFNPDAPVTRAEAAALAARLARPEQRVDLF